MITGSTTGTGTQENEDKTVVFCAVCCQHLASAYAPDAEYVTVRTKEQKMHDLIL
jgi:hypothetical protein